MWTRRGAKALAKAPRKDRTGQQIHGRSDAKVAPRRPSQRVARAPHAPLPMSSHMLYRVIRRSHGGVRTFKTLVATRNCTPPFSNTTHTLSMNIDFFPINRLHRRVFAFYDCSTPLTIGTHLVFQAARPAFDNAV